MLVGLNRKNCSQNKLAENSKRTEEHVKEHYNEWAGIIMLNVSTEWPRVALSVSHGSTYARRRQL